MIRRPPRSTQSRSSAASDVYKRQLLDGASAAGESAAAELGVRIALPLALCLMPAFILTGIVPLLVALAGSVMGDAGGCLLYTSDAADDLLCVDLGGRR